MPAFTSFLNLYKPGGGSTGLITPDEVVDVDRLNQNSDLIDAFASNSNTRLSDIEAGKRHPFVPVVASSAARDALFPAPVNGQRVWRSDLGEEQYYTSSNSQWNRNSPGMVLVESGTFSAATLLVAGGFSDRFTNYRVLFQVNSASATHGLSIMMRNGSSNDSSANYSSQQTWARGNAATNPALQTAQTSWPGCPVAATVHDLDILVVRPFASQPTRLQIDGSSVASAADLINFSTTGYHNVNSSFDAIRLAPSTGNFSGQYAVYGLNG